LGEGQPQLFDVHVSGFDTEDGDRAVQGLVEVLGLGPEQAARILWRAPVNVREGLEESHARELVQRLRAKGARVALLPSRALLPSARAPSPLPPLGNGADDLVHLPPATVVLAPTDGQEPRPAVRPPAPAAQTAVQGAEVGDPPAPRDRPLSAGSRVLDPPASIPPPGAYSAAPSAPGLKMASNPNEFAASLVPPSRRPNNAVDDRSSLLPDLPVIAPLLSSQERQRRRGETSAEARPSFVGLDRDSLLPNQPSMPPGLPELPEPASAGPGLDVDSSIPASLRGGDSSIPPALGGGDSSIPPALGGGDSSMPPALVIDGMPAVQQSAFPTGAGATHRGLIRSRRAIGRGFAGLQGWAKGVEREPQADGGFARARAELATSLVWAFETLGPATARTVRAVEALFGGLLDRAEAGLGRLLGREPGPSTVEPELPGPTRTGSFDGSTWPSAQPLVSRRPRREPEPEPGSPWVTRGIMVVGSLAVLYAGVHFEHSIFRGNADLLWTSLHAAAFYALGLALRPKSG